MACDPWGFYAINCLTSGNDLIIRVDTQASGRSSLESFRCHFTCPPAVDLWSRISLFCMKDKWCHARGEICKTASIRKQDLHLLPVFKEDNVHVFCLQSCSHFHRFLLAHANLLGVIYHQTVFVRGKYTVNFASLRLWSSYMLNKL